MWRTCHAPFHFSGLIQEGFKIAEKNQNHYLTSQGWIQSGSVTWMNAGSNRRKGEKKVEGRGGRGVLSKKAEMEGYGFRFIVQGFLGVQSS